MDMRKRSWAKSVTWRVLGVVILYVISYLITRDWGKTTGITLIFHSLRLVLYYFHERSWERISWGKVKHPLAHLSVRENLTAEDYEAIQKFLETQRYIAQPPEYQI